MVTIIRTKKTKDLLEPVTYCMYAVLDAAQLRKEFKRTHSSCLGVLGDLIDCLHFSGGQEVAGESGRHAQRPLQEGKRDSAKQWLVYSSSV